MTAPSPSPSPTPLGPYTPIVRAGDWLVCSGQVGAIGGRLVEGGVTAQVTQALQNVATLLSAEGASLADVVKTTVFLADIGDFAAMNEAYTAAFASASASSAAAGAPRPARSAVAVAALPLGAAVEIEAWAFTGRR